MKAYILIQTKPGTSEEVVADIKKRVKEAISVDSVYGRFDAIVVVEAPDIERINEIVYKVVGKDPNIVHTETSITL
ncbi:MAG: Lrp/AsnC ligand binding domain-containing protein [Candidatus Bathyarchaeota archaeon]|nr:Lrp/AsnC ligand binding domain-containing protein [Candidatus Bathyarchaeota archaeon]